MIGEIHNNNKSSTDSNAPVKKKKSSKNTPPATTVTGTVESCDQIAETLEDISIVAINERSTQRAGCELNQSEQIVQLVELVAGSGVFLSRTALALYKTAHTKSSLATRLLKAFFSEERREGKISEQGEVGNLLNQQIITTIKAYASRQNLPDGCKKGITSAMNLSIKNLRRAARKSACEDDLPSLPSLPDDDDDDDYDADESA
ncbi:uncharacterized protein LOC116601377 isoform X3 [Nematostella vectensis]|uniref:uncharacterized protein LOC116601377 isoform X3 n=1 Tax=Nematostella vectensis TaxID=45351 RepID=UPI0013900106|nr:uncharacterized protein LOC116601377 isoform X3 [Nematostella vectensis]